MGNGLKIWIPVIAVAIFSITVVSNFSINSDVPETGMLSMDFTDFQTDQARVVLHETEIGNQYIIPLKKSVPNTEWEETEFFLEVTISEDQIKKNISYDYYSKMPRPSQMVLDRAAEKDKNPMPISEPYLPQTGISLINPPDDAINVDDFLDKVKKKLK